ncbi:MAG TPA: hypothetical protein VLD16_13885 [Gaiellaceae bacterium]|nr:hypothetical protein [Gaiellaceae bacterium]
MVSCRLLGHRYRFRAEGATMVWQCQRGCGAGGSKEYASAGDATRYARAFDHEDRNDLGRRAPFIGLFPLRLYRRLKGQP